MSNTSALKKSLSRLTLVTGILLLVLGFSVWSISVYVIQDREQILNNPDTTLDKMWQAEGSLSWWRKTYDALLFPLSIGSVALGASVLVSRQLWLKMPKNHSFKTSRDNDFDNEKILSKTNDIDETILNVVVAKKPTIKTKDCIEGTVSTNGEVP